MRQKIDYTLNKVAENVTSMVSAITSIPEKISEYATVSPDTHDPVGDMKRNEALWVRNFLDDDKKLIHAANKDLRDFATYVHDHYLSHAATQITSATMIGKWQNYQHLRGDCGVGGYAQGKELTNSISNTKNKLKTGYNKLYDVIEKSTLLSTENFAESFVYALLFKDIIKAIENGKAIESGKYIENGKYIEKDISIPDTDPKPMILCAVKFLEEYPLIVPFMENVSKTFLGEFFSTKTPRLCYEAPDFHKYNFECFTGDSASPIVKAVLKNDKSVIYAHLAPYIAKRAKPFLDSKEGKNIVDEQKCDKETAEAIIKKIGDNLGGLKDINEYVQGFLAHMHSTAKIKHNDFEVPAHLTWLNEAKDQINKMYNPKKSDIEQTKIDQWFVSKYYLEIAEKEAMSAEEAKVDTMDSHDILPLPIKPESELETSITGEAAE